MELVAHQNNMFSRCERGGNIPITKKDWTSPSTIKGDHASTERIPSLIVDTSKKPSLISHISSIHELLQTGIDTEKSSPVASLRLSKERQNPTPKADKIHRLSIALLQNPTYESVPTLCDRLGIQQKAFGGMVKKILEAPQTNDTLSNLWESAQEYNTPASRFAVAILLSQAEKMPPFVIQTTKGVIADSKATIIPVYKNWYLCPESEPKMRAALRLHTSFLVDNTLLVKPEENGLMTGLCVQFCQTKNGIFVPGIWYSPIDKDTRQKLKKATYTGEKRVGLTEPSTWVIQRPLQNESLTKYMHHAQELRIIEDFQPNRIKVAPQDDELDELLEESELTATDLITHS